jgi:(p)ppGpp synthase/HD superfamily hydrolase
MIYSDMTKKAINVMYEAHHGQKDKGGFPYCFHPYQVAQGMEDEISCTCALLHDVVEDTDITMEDLTDMGFPKEVTDVLKLLTHEKGIPYMDYVRNLAENPTARRVKLADLKHNSDLTRLKEVTDRDLERIEKYRKAIAFLEGIDIQK